MTTMNISMPESMKEFIDEQIQKEGFGTVSEYFRSLVRAEQKRQAQERLEELLIEGLDSGFEEVTPADWESIRQEVRNRAAARKQKA